MSAAPPTQPRTTTSRQEIVDAAVELADAEGLDAVSMRRLAEKLGVGTMTPYTYVESKDELLDLMRDEVGRAMLVPEPLPDDWRQGLRAIAMRTRDAFEAHGWIADARSSRPRIRINMARHIEQSISVIEGLGIDGKTGAAVLTAVDDYVIGHCLRQRSRQRAIRAIRAAAAAHEEEQPALDPEVAAAIESGELARVGRMLERRRGSKLAGVPPEPDFERGLEWLLDGIETMAGGAEHPLESLLLDRTDAVAGGGEPR
jgi:AcrR family transcriptional regulator